MTQLQLVISLATQLSQASGDRLVAVEQIRSLMRRLQVEASKLDLEDSKTFCDWSLDQMEKTFAKYEPQ